MSTITCPDSFKDLPDPACFISSALQQVEGVEALANLDDQQLLTFVKKGVKPSRSKQMAATAHRLATAFERIASLLGAQESSALLADFRRQAKESMANLVASKQIVPSAEFIEALGITRQALSKAVLAHRLFSVEAGGENYYPVFYTWPDIDRRALERITRMLGDLGGWQKWQFFTSPKGSLGDVTPLEALRQGRYKEVAITAAGFVER
jgi:hypothetical protein